MSKEELISRFNLLMLYLLDNHVDQKLSVKMMSKGIKLRMKIKGDEILIIDSTNFLWTYRDVFIKEKKDIADHFLKHDFTRQKDDWVRDFKIPRKLANNVVDTIKHNVVKILETDDDKTYKMLKQSFNTFMEYMKLD